MVEGRSAHLIYEKLLGKTAATPTRLQRIGQVNMAGISAKLAAVLPSKGANSSPPRAANLPTLSLRNLEPTKICVY